MFHSTAFYAHRGGEDVVDHARPLEALVDLDVAMKDTDTRFGAVDFLDRGVPGLQFVVDLHRRGDTLDHAFLIDPLAEIESMIQGILAHGHALNRPHAL